MRVRERIQDAIASALAAIGVLEFEIELEHPAELKNGDYSANTALVYSKQLGKKPRELAEAIVSNLGDIKGVERTEIAGPGFINFYLSKKEIATALDSARIEDVWGANEALKGRNVMVEYTQPNPFKEFHIGHLMSNAVGESLSRLFQFSGAHVIRANYQGDVGPHVAKAIWALIQGGHKKPTSAQISEAYVRGSEAYESDAKEAIDAINKKIYERTDQEINSLYDHGRRVTLEHFEKIYKMLGTAFDLYFFESETGPRGVRIVKAHPQLFEVSEGATVFRGEAYGLHTRVFLNKLGLPTYEAKELGLAELKKERAEFDTSITVTAHEQSDYFKVVLKALELVHPEWDGQFKHLSHGMMRFSDRKMSSRKGNVITGESLLQDLKDAAKERAKVSRAEHPDKLAEQVAVAAIKYQILKQGSGHDIVFERERALSLEGDSGPYLQYSYARASAIVERAKEQNAKISIDHDQEASDLGKVVRRLPEIVERAAKMREPHIVTGYLLSVAALFNGWYAKEQILDGTDAQAHKVALADAVRKTLRNGLWILGIPTPEKM